MAARLRAAKPQLLGKVGFMIGGEGSEGGAVEVFDGLELGVNHGNYVANCRGVGGVLQFDIERSPFEIGVEPGISGVYIGEGDGDGKRKAVGVMACSRVWW